MLVAYNYCRKGEECAEELNHFTFQCWEKDMILLRI